MRIPFALAVLVCTAACATSRDVPEQVDDGLGKTSLALLQSDADTGSYQLYITKAALQGGSEFLLSTSALQTNLGEPSFSGMLSRVVQFKRADGKIHMLESSKGAAVSADLIKPNIIASFPILSENDSAVGVSFNDGAKSLLLAFDWTASDSDDSESLFSSRFTSADLVQRYVDEGATDAKGRITIRQVAQADLGGGSGTTVELRYFLQPYTPNPAYPKLVSKQDFRWGGFFESSPTVLAGTAGWERFVSRFDPQQPLVYAISSNTPQEVKQAVRDGILYWNRVLGREWIQVVDAPAGVTAPNLDYNLVQWVPEKGATFAYADAQLDPLTGEVKNAQVYLPSGWYDSTEPYVADSYARRVEALASAKQPKPSASPTQPASTGQTDKPAKGKLPANVRSRASLGACNKLNERALEVAGKKLLRRGLSSDDIKLALLDWVRSTTAHEVGHTLGLRHNFAGSLGSNIAPDELDGIFTHYFESGGDWPADKLPGSSVMEYPAFEDDVGIGAFIRLGHPALAHDKAVMGALYNGAPLPAGGPLFCTDSESDFTPDCTAYDRGSDVVESLGFKIQDDLHNAAAEYVYWLRAAKRAEQGDVFSATSAEADAQTAYAARSTVAQLLTSQSQLLAADRAIGSPAVNAAEIHQSSLKRVGETVLAAGGYEPFFGLLPDDFEERFNAQLDDLLSQPWITSGTTKFGGAWSFTDEELTQIRAYAPRYLATYRAAAAAADIATLSLSGGAGSATIIILGGDGLSPISSFQPQWEAPVLADELNQLLADRVTYYLTATSGTFRAKVAVRSVSETPVSTPSTPSTPSPGKPGKGQGGGSGEGKQPAPEPSETPSSTGPAVVIRTLKLPRFTYPTELRTQAPQLLSPSQSADRIWARDVRDEPAIALATQLDAAAQGSFDALELDGSDPEAQRWILDNQDVLGAVGGPPDTLLSASLP